MERKGARNERRRGIQNGKEGETRGRERTIEEWVEDMKREEEERMRNNRCNKRGKRGNKGEREERGERENGRTEARRGKRKENGWGKKG